MTVTYPRTMESVWRHRLIVAAPLIGVFLVGLGSTVEDGPTLCPFALCTGTACPGCGMTRAASSVVRGDWGRALSFHPLVFLVLAQLAGAWIWYLLRRSGRVEPIGQRTLNLVLLANLLALVVVWLIRMAAGTLPPV
ncbi:MAG TPA: DUF2752 domain-containing protein [Acidimicrobiia bacterium]